MKVMFPQNIKKGFFSGIAFSIMWISISFPQLIILAIWVMIALGIFSAWKKGEATWWAAVLAIFIFLIFVVIAFFSVSELNLVAFITKKIKDWFLDVSKKFQINYLKYNPVDIAIKKSKQTKWKQRIEIKEWLDSEKLSKLTDWGIL